MPRPRRVLPTPAALSLALLVASSACARDQATAPGTAPGTATPVRQASPSSLAHEVRELAAGRGIGPLHRPPPVRAELVRLGRALAFDKILSGNRDISCMTCHHPTLATGDGRSLSIGQGASGLGTERVHPGDAFIPRNAPPLFNLHALKSLFWDGRVSVDEHGAFHTPVGEHLTARMTRVFEFGALSGLGLFPVLSRIEMRAVRGNELAAIDDREPGKVWEALMARLGEITEYREMFEAAYPGTEFRRMTFAHASNALAGFFIEELSFVDTPWDRFLAGNDRALTDQQLRGAKNFLSARCSICHGGPALTDNQFHNVAVAQLGPGQGNGASGTDDFGRFNVTGRPEDRYAFRSTPLRNVELTAPYGHDGAFVDLRAFIDHYSESAVKLYHYDVRQLEPLLRGTLLANFEDILATRDTLLEGVVFPDEVIDEVAAYMKALTDDAARDLRHLIPRRVPSGLRID